MSGIKWGGNLQAQVVKVSAIKPNPWNPNKQDDETFEKVRLSIRQHGFVDPPLVRELDDGSLQIVDGEHKWRAAHAEGIQDIPVINGGKISDEDAKKLTIIMNELKGSPDPVLMSGLIKDLSSSFPLDALSLELPMSKGELEALVNIATPFDWDAVEASIPSAASKPAAPLPTNERRFQLGQMKGNIPARLSEELTSEFNRSARALGTANLEIVLGHWLKRLQETADKTNEEAAQVTAVQPTQPVRRSKKAAQ